MPKVWRVYFRNDKTGEIRTDSTVANDKIAAETQAKLYLERRGLTNMSVLKIEKFADKTV